MNKLLLFCTIIFLSGCSTLLPVKQKFPEVPTQLMTKCEPLSTIDEPKVVFSEFLKVVTENYTKRHSCAKLVEYWQEWYIEQKKIFDETNK